MILPLRAPQQLSQGGFLHRALRTRRGDPRARVKKDAGPTPVGPSQGVVWWTFVPAQRNVVNVDLKSPSALWLFSPLHESLDPFPFIRLPSPLAHKNRKLRWIARGTNRWHTFSAQFTTYQSPPDPLGPVFDLRRLVNVYGRCRSVNLGPWRSTRAAGWRHINS